MAHSLYAVWALKPHQAEGAPLWSGAAGLRSLRTARDLEKDMVLTVESGSYFIDLLLDAALEDPVQQQFLVKDAREVRGTGGVRLEDGIVVTLDGCENLTVCPQSIGKVEAVVAGEA